eukprot:1189809-Prorocentrum_minimum.AAC.6
MRRRVIDMNWPARNSSRLDGQRKWDDKHAQHLLGVDIQFIFVPPHGDRRTPSRSVERAFSLEPIIWIILTRPTGINDTRSRCWQALLKTGAPYPIGIIYYRILRPPWLTIVTNSDLSFCCIHTSGGRFSTGYAATKILQTVYAPSTIELPQATQHPKHLFGVTNCLDETCRNELAEKLARVYNLGRTSPACVQLEAVDYSPVAMHAMAARAQNMSHHWLLQYQVRTSRTARSNCCCAVTTTTISPDMYSYMHYIYNITSFYGSSCANNGKGALNTPDVMDAQRLCYRTSCFDVVIDKGTLHP